MKPARLGLPPWHLGPLNPLSHHLWGQFLYAVLIQSLKILGFLDEGQAHPENGSLGSGLAPPTIVDVSLQDCGKRLLFTSHSVWGFVMAARADWDARHAVSSLCMPGTVLNAFSVCLFYC